MEDWMYSALSFLLFLIPFLVLQYRQYNRKKAEKKDAKHNAPPAAPPPPEPQFSYDRTEPSGEFVSVDWEDEEQSIAEDAIVTELTEPSEHFLPEMCSFMESWLSYGDAFSRYWASMPEHQQRALVRAVLPWVPDNKEAITSKPVKDLEDMPYTCAIAPDLNLQDLCCTTGARSLLGVMHAREQQARAHINQDQTAATATPFPSPHDKSDSDAANEALMAGRVSRKAPDRFVWTEGARAGREVVEDAKRGLTVQYVIKRMGGGALPSDVFHNTRARLHVVYGALARVLRAFERGVLRESACSACGKAPLAPAGSALQAAAPMTPCACGRVRYCSSECRVAHLGKHQKDCAGGMRQDGLEEHAAKEEAKKDK